MKKSVPCRGKSPSVPKNAKMGRGFKFGAGEKGRAYPGAIDKRVTKRGNPPGGR